MFQIYIVKGQRFTKLYLNINSPVRLFYNWNAYLIKLINCFFFFSFITGITTMIGELFLLQLYITQKAYMFYNEIYHDK